MIQEANSFMTSVQVLTYVSSTLSILLHELLNKKSKMSKYYVVLGK